MKYDWAFLAIGLVAALGCGGKSLNDVGDLSTGGAGAAGAGGGSGATGAAPGTGGGSGAAGGTGGSIGGNSDIGACNEGDGCIFEVGDRIRALAADTTHLYWVEYGPSDGPGGYPNNGRLLSRAFDSTVVTTLAIGLAGPVGVAVTSTHVYVWVDFLWYEGDERIAVVRVPLAGGELQTVHVDLSQPRTYGKCGTSGKCFYTHDDAGYWTFRDGTYGVTAESDEALRIVDEPLEVIGVDESYLYYVGDQAGPGQPIDLYRLPRAGGDAELVTNDARNARRAVSGEYVYALEGSLLRMPKAGGSWTALAQFYAAAAYELFVSDDDFFFDGQPSDSIEWTLRHGSLSNPVSAPVVVHLASPPQSWVGIPSGAYWTDGSTIYFRDID